MDPLYKTFAKYGWSDVYYANPWLPNECPQFDIPNRWYVGVRTGPKKDTICVRQCKTEDEVMKFKSAGGSSINEAVHKAVRLYEMTEPGCETKYSSCRAKKLSVN
jgi:hypothetical protein